jgi:hypothetical protein
VQWTSTTQKRRRAVAKETGGSPVEEGAGALVLDGHAAVVVGDGAVWIDDDEGRDAGDAELQTTEAA